MTGLTKAAAFRKRFLGSSEPLIIVGAHDGLGAQLIEKHGFDGAWASGLEISASHGVPDANILTMTQYLERAQEMNMASGLPIVCDVDTGYGNSSNVHYMVQQYEAADIAAIVMEDKLFPKVNSFMPGRQELASITEFCGKIEAAKAAQRGPDFVVIARVEALIAGWGMAEALKRAEAYMKAGADAILMHSKSSKPDEIRQFLKEWKKRCPVVLVPTTYPDLTYKEMAELGVNMIIFANQALRASIAAQHKVLSIMKEQRSTTAIEAEIASVKEIFELQGMMAMKEHEKKYLRTGKAFRVIIPAAGKPNHEGAMAKLLTERPAAMLDVEGKPLLHRILDNLNLSGLQDITVMTGYKGDMITIPTGTLQPVADAEKTGLFHSILEAKDAFKGPTLIHYGDVIVSPENIRALLDAEAPIAIAVSPLQREGRYEKKHFDFVAVKNPSSHTRTLSAHPQNTLAAIGSDVPTDKVYGEFTGLVVLNQDGADLWKKEAAAIPAAKRATMSLTDFLQHLLSKNTEIQTFEMRAGWAEVHSGEDLDQLRSLFSSR